MSRSGSQILADRLVEFDSPPTRVSSCSNPGERTVDLVTERRSGLLIQVPNDRRNLRSSSNLSAARRVGTVWASNGDTRTWNASRPRCRILNPEPRLRFGPLATRVQHCRGTCDEGLHGLTAVRPLRPPCGLFPDSQKAIRPDGGRCSEAQGAPSCCSALSCTAPSAQRINDRVALQRGPCARRHATLEPCLALFLAQQINKALRCRLVGEGLPKSCLLAEHRRTGRVPPVCVLLQSQRMAQSLTSDRPLDDKRHHLGPSYLANACGGELLQGLPPSSLPASHKSQNDTRPP